MTHNMTHKKMSAYVVAAVAGLALAGGCDNNQRTTRGMNGSDGGRAMTGGSTPQRGSYAGDGVQSPGAVGRDQSGQAATATSDAGTIATSAGTNRASQGSTSNQRTTSGQAQNAGQSWSGQGTTGASGQPGQDARAGTQGGDNVYRATMQNSGSGSGSWDDAGPGWNGRAGDQGAPQTDRNTGSYNQSADAARSGADTWPHNSDGGKNFQDEDRRGTPGSTNRSGTTTGSTMTGGATGTTRAGGQDQGAYGQPATGSGSARTGQDDPSWPRNSDAGKTRQDEQDIRDAQRAQGTNQTGAGMGRDNASRDTMQNRQQMGGQQGMTQNDAQNRQQTSGQQGMTQNDAQNRQQTSGQQGMTQNDAQNRQQVGAVDAARDFIEQAVLANLMETRLGLMGAWRGSSDEVREFGREMSRAHTAAQAELVRTACYANVLDLPQALGERQTGTEQRLLGLEGAEFDREFMRVMVEEHERAVQLFEGASAAANSAVRTYATQMLPRLREHLEMARSTHDQLAAANGGRDR